MSSKGSNESTRFGIGELYGHDFMMLSPAEIRKLSKAKFKSQQCPFRGARVKCNKNGGVCSLRQYSNDEGSAKPVKSTSLVATCPSRFHDSNVAVSWAGEALLGTDSPIVLTELPFLMSESRTKPDSEPSAVGKIDVILVHPDTAILRWCALEIQAVYFSGNSMGAEFKAMKTWEGPGAPFPIGKRRPDFRSSGPKRLMPQLQIKVPTISRWGKKTAVVVDLPFWESLGDIPEVQQGSNCDIAWFVMAYKHDGKRFLMKRHSLHLTTLDRAVEGLTGGKPTSLGDFETRLMVKLTDILSR